MHLSRHKGEAPSADDYDHSSPRKKLRSLSIGEELWQVHLHRAAGMEPDVDVDKAPKSSKASSNTKTASKLRHKASRQAEQPVACGVMHLRNRDVKKTMMIK